MYKGIERFGKMMDQNSKKISSSPEKFELGTIASDYTLTTDTFKIPIPPTSYLVSVPFIGFETAQAGINPHTHEIKKMIAPGRVLVLWVGRDAIVLSNIITGGGLNG